MPEKHKNKLMWQSYFFIFRMLKSNVTYFFTSNTFISNTRLRFDPNKGWEFHMLKLTVTSCYLLSSNWISLFVCAIRLGVYWGRFRTPVTFKQMPHFFTDDNQITTLFILYSNRLVDRVFVNWHWILKIEYNDHILNSQWPVVIFCQAIE